VVFPVQGIPVMITKGFSDISPSECVIFWLKAQEVGFPKSLVLKVENSITL